MALIPEDIFVNCPFDDEYKRSSMRSSSRSPDRDTGSGARWKPTMPAIIASTKSAAFIATCKFGIHDISRTEPTGDPPLPRFNMPLELGLFPGARRFGGEEQKGKVCVVFDREKYRFQRYISDIAGQDIHAHGGKADALIRELATWLRAQPGNLPVGGGAALVDEYTQFQQAVLPAVCASCRIRLDELSFSDFTQIVTEYVTVLRGNPTVAKA